MLKEPKYKAWERFVQVVPSNDTVTDHVICSSYEALNKYDGHKTGASNVQNLHIRGSS